MTENQKMYQTSEKEKEPLKWPKYELINPASAAKISPAHAIAYKEAYYAHQLVIRYMELSDQAMSDLRKCFDLGMSSDIVRQRRVLTGLLSSVDYYLARFNRFGLKAFQLGSAPEPAAH